MHAYECLGSPRKSYELAGGLGNSLEVLASQPADCNQVMHEQGAGLDAARDWAPRWSCCAAALRDRSTAQLHHPWNA